MLTLEQAKEQRTTLAPSRLTPGHSPWGHVQSYTKFADGIVQIETAGHGGFHLSAARLEAMPAALRKIDDRYCPLNWFEEDCEWALVALSFPDHFTSDEFNVAVRTLFTTYPEHFAAWVASLNYPADIVNALVERLHAERYPKGCPNRCEACAARLTHTAPPLPRETAGALIARECATRWGVK